MTTISSARRSFSTTTSSSNRQPPPGPPGAQQLEQKLTASGLSADKVKSTMKTLFGERGGNGGGTLNGTEGVGSKDFALKLQSALMNAGVSDSDARSVVSSVGSGNTSAATSTSSTSSTADVDSFDDDSSTSSRTAPAGAEELEARLRAAGLSDDQVKASMKKLYGDRGGSGGGTVDGSEETGSQSLALKLQSALMSAGITDDDAKSVVSSVGSASTSSRWGYSGVSSFE